MKSNNFKHIYALVLLGLTFAWAVFATWMTYRALQTLKAEDFLGAAGVDTLLGALITWNATIIQHYFRKAIPEDSPPGTTTTTNSSTTTETPAKPPGV